MLVSGGWDRTIRVWDARTWKQARTLEGHDGSVDCVAFSPDGFTLASGGRDTTIRLWDSRTGEGTHTLEGHSDDVESVAFSPDGFTLASGSDDDTIRLWDVRTGEAIQTLQDNSRRGSYVVAFSPGGLTLAGARLPNGASVPSPRGRIELWDTRTWEHVQTLEGHKATVGCVAFSPDGNTLASGGGWYDDTVRLWDTRTWKQTHTLVGHIRGVESVAFSPDGATLVSKGDGDTVRLWDARTGELLGRPETFASTVSSIAFSPDGSMLVWNEWNIIRSWDVRTGVLRYPDFGGHSGSVNSVAFSPDGGTLASGSSNTSIGLWDVRARENKQLFYGHKGGVTSVAFSPGGFMLASGGRDKTVRLWDARTGEHIRALSGHMDEINTVAFSHDGEMVASCSGGPFPWCDNNDNTIRIWDARTGEHMHTLEGHMDAVTSVAFSPDGNTLVSGSRDSTILLWEFRRFATWGDIKYTAADGTMHTPELPSSITALMPVGTALLPNYPNPFHPETWIPYQLKKSAEVTLTIYDMNGGRVRTLAVGHQPAGVYRSHERAAYWDGRNRRGELVANGVYFYTLSAGDFSATRKMLVGK